MQIDGDKNIVANAGGVAQQINNINIEGMNEEQFKALSEQMNQVLAAIGIKNEIGQEPAGVTPEQQVIGEVVRQKMDEADASFAEPSGTPEAYLKLGNFEYESGNLDKAVEYYDKIIVIDPQHNAAWYNKGNALYGLGRKEDAIRCYDMALEIDMAWNNKGTALSDLGRKDEAIKCYDRALDINPKYDGAWCSKGNALSSLGRKDEAIRCYDMALEINPKYDDVWCNKGVALSDLGRKDEAIRCYDRALEINPKDDFAWNNKGTALEDLGRKDEAIRCYDRALEINPKYDSAWYNKGCCWGSIGVHDEAYRCFDRVIEINPADQDAREMRDLALNMMKNRG